MAESWLAGFPGEGQNKVGQETRDRCDPDNPDLPAAPFSLIIGPLQIFELAFDHLGSNPDITEPIIKPGNGGIKPSNIFTEVGRSFIEGRDSNAEFPR